MSIIALDDVSVRFHVPGRPVVHALKGVTAAVAEGETLGIVGESGSGKSTMASVALGLVRPRAGSVTFLGEPLRSAARRGAMQAVLQHPIWALNPRLRVGQSIAEPLRVARRRGSAPVTGRASIDDRVHELLASVRLDESIADRLPHELSGGQRQRVAIARALITEPRFIVFDEAVSALDVSVQAEILKLIRRLQHEHRFAALFISHDLDVVRFIADRIAVMRYGEIVETSTVAEFSAGPSHPYSQSLMEARA